MRIEKSRWGPFYKTYHTLIYLSVVSAVAELAYSVLNQSAIPPYAQHIGLKAQVGIVIGTFLIVEAMLKSPMGCLGDRLGRRPLIVGGALISCVTALIMTVTTKLPYLLVLRAFDGVAAAAIWPTLIAAISGSVPRYQRTMAMSAMTVTYMSGVALGPLLGGLTNDLTGSKTASFYLVSLLFLATALVAWFLTPHRCREEMECDDVHEEGFRLSQLSIGIRSVPDMMLTAFIAFLGVGLLIPIVKYFAMDELGLNETGFGVLVLPIAIAVAIASLLAGRLGDRWGKARSVRLGIALAALAMWAVLGSHSAWQFAIVGILLGVGFVIAMPAWLALVSDMSSPRVRGAVVGALGTAQGIGAVVGTVLGSHLYEKVQIGGFLGLDLNSHYSPFAVSALALTVCFVLVMVFVKDHDGRWIGGQPNGLTDGDARRSGLAGSG